MVWSFSRPKLSLFFVLLPFIGNLQYFCLQLCRSSSSDYLSSHLFSSKSCYAIFQQDRSLHRGHGKFSLADLLIDHPHFGGWGSSAEALVVSGLEILPLTSQTMTVSSLLQNPPALADLQSLPIMMFNTTLPGCTISMVPPIKFTQAVRTDFGLI